MHACKKKKKKKKGKKRKEENAIIHACPLFSPTPAAI